MRTSQIQTLRRSTLSWDLSLVQMQVRLHSSSELCVDSKVLVQAFPTPNHLGDCMHHLGFKPCLADPDLWMLATVCPDGFEYYANVLLYVDGVMVIHHKALSILSLLDKYFKMNLDRSATL